MEIAARDFNQRVNDAKTQAEIEPVFITNRGKRTHVLLSIEQWNELFQPSKNWDLVAPSADIYIEVPRSTEPARAAEF